METYVAVTFTVEENTGRKRSRSPWQYHVEWEEKETGSGKDRLLLATVFLPDRPQKKKNWTKESLQSYLQSLPVPGESRYVYYYYAQAAAGLLGRQNDCLSTEWAFFLLTFYNISFEGLLLFEEPGVCTEDWFFSYAGNTRYLGILTRDTGRVEQLAEQLYEEYGAMLHIYAGVSHCRFRESCRTLLVMGEETYGLMPVYVGENNVLHLMRDDLSNSVQDSRIPPGRVISIGKFLHQISASNTRKMLYNRGNVV